jgi:hypothetical protein
VFGVAGWLDYRDASQERKTKMSLGFLWPVGLLCLWILISGE